MKKIITLAFLMAFVLSACGDGGDFMMKKKEKSPSENTPEEEVSDVEPMISFEQFQVYKTCGPYYIKCNKTFQDGVAIMQEILKNEDMTMEELLDNEENEDAKDKDSSSSSIMPYLYFKK